MKINISALMNLISEYEKNYSNYGYNLKSYAINTSTQELDGRITIIEDNKEAFDDNLKELEECAKELSRLKAILYEKNNSFKLKDGRSIQQAIVDNTNLRKLKSYYENLTYMRDSKKRVTEVNNSYFECRSINFDADYVRERLQELDNIIQNTDFEISKLNSIEFEI